MMTQLFLSALLFITKHTGFVGILSHVVCRWHGSCMSLGYFVQSGTTIDYGHTCMELYLWMNGFWADSFSGAGPSMLVLEGLGKLRCVPRSLPSYIG